MSLAKVLSAEMFETPSIPFNSEAGGAAIGGVVVVDDVSGVFVGMLVAVAGLAIVCVLVVGAGVRTIGVAVVEARVREGDFCLGFGNIAALGGAAEGAVGSTTGILSSRGRMEGCTLSVAKLVFNSFACVIKV